MLTMENNYHKEFKTLSEQVKKLSRKYHLTITNTEEAKKLLLKRNYFDLINGLEELFPNGSNKPKDFSDYTFNDFIQLYDINVDLRTAGLKIIAEFEAQLKSITAYFFNEHFNAENPSDDNTLAYINPHNFYPNYSTANQNSDYDSIKNSFDLFKNKENVPNRYAQYVDEQSQNSIMLYKNVYMAGKMNQRNLLHNFPIPPLWVTIKIFDFGELTKFIALSPSNVSTKVRKEMLFNSYTEKQFIGALFAIKNLRNHMAHIQMLNKFTNTVKYNLEQPIKVDDNYIDGENLTVFHIFTLLSTSVSLKPLKPSIDLIKNLTPEISSSLLQAMGNKNLSEWIKIVDGH